MSTASASASTASTFSSSPSNPRRSPSYSRPDFAHALLTATEERDLARRIQASPRDDRGRLTGDGAVARDRLVECNFALVMKLASRYTGKGLDLDDLEQWGRFGLMEAAELFNPAKGRFTTIAWHYVLKYIRRKVVDEGSLIRVPSHIHQYRTSMALGSKVRTTPKPEHLEAGNTALKLHIGGNAGDTEDRIRLANVVDREGGNGVVVSGVRGDAGHASQGTAGPIDIEMDIDVIPSLLGGLTDRQANVIRYRFGLDGQTPLTLLQVGRIYGISRERVRQIERKALTRMQIMMDRRMRAQKGWV